MSAHPILSAAEQCLVANDFVQTEMVRYGVSQFAVPVTASGKHVGHVTVGIAFDEIDEGCTSPTGFLCIEGFVGHSDGAGAWTRHPGRKFADGEWPREMESLDLDLPPFVYLEPRNYCGDGTTFPCLVSRHCFHERDAFPEHLFPCMFDSVRHVLETYHSELRSLTASD